MASAARGVDTRGAMIDREGMRRALMMLGSRRGLPWVTTLALVAACSSAPAPQPAAGEAASESSPTDTAAQPDDDEPPPTEENAVTQPPVQDDVVDTTVQVIATGAAPPPAQPVLAEPAGVVDDAQFVGRWMVSGSVSSGPPGSPGGGGAIGWMREFELRADHTFQMNAYPSLTERGTWRRVGTQGARAELVYDENSRLADGSPIITPVIGLAEAGQPLRALDIGGQRFPRVLPNPPPDPAMPPDPAQPTRTP